MVSAIHVGGRARWGHCRCQRHRRRSGRRSRERLHRETPLTTHVGARRRAVVGPWIETRGPLTLDSGASRMGPERHRATTDDWGARANLRRGKDRAMTHPDRSQIAIAVSLAAGIVYGLLHAAMINAVWRDPYPVKPACSPAVLVDGSGPQLGRAGRPLNVAERGIWFGMGWYPATRSRGPG